MPVGSPAPASSSPGRLASLLAGLVRREDDPRVLGAQRETLLARASTACWLAMVVMPFTIISYNAVFFPHRIVEGLLVSLGADIASLVVLVLLKRGYFDAMPAVPMLILLGVICNVTENLQIVLTGGVEGSHFLFPYYLIFFGITAFYTARLAPVLLTCLLLPAGYFVTGVISGADLVSVGFVTNVILLVDYALITVIANRVITGMYLRDARLVLDLEDANEQLREVDRIKSEFFANISHELRTPLTLILAPASSLILQGPGPLNEQQLTLMDGIRHNAARLLSLINDLLLLSRLEAGRLERRREPVDLARAAQRVVDTMRMHASELGVSLAVEAPKELVSWNGDARHAERILVNLLSNAVKFSDPGGSVEVRLAQDEESLVLSVTDQGIGIPAEHQGRLFDRFVQIDSASNRRYEGSGIGLSIVKELAELHGGEVHVTSEPGRGSTFEVRLPIGSPAEAPSAEDELAEAEVNPELDILWQPRLRDAVSRQLRDGSGGRVLVVEDNADLRRYLVQELERRYRVSAHPDATSALEEMSQSVPEVVVTDVMLPNIDGIELARRIRDDAALHDVPVIVMSARDDVDTKLAGFAAGVDDYVPKPFQIPELVARIEVHLRLNRQAKDLRRTVSELDQAMKQLKETESSMLHHEKMAVLGRVVAGVAHETNNPLHFIKGNLRELRRRLGPDEGQGEAVSAILTDLDASVRRLEGVTHQLLMLGRKQVDTASYVRLTELFPLASRMVQPPTGEVSIELDVPEDAIVHANPQDLFQVVLNLLHNAVQAVGETGGRIRVGSTEANGHVEIRFEDEGCGIPAENLSQILEPFFTTKPVGQGTGLGLAIAHKLVVAAHGTLDIDSEVGKGTVVTVRLPRAEL